MDISDRRPSMLDTPEERASAITGRPARSSRRTSDRTADETNDSAGLTTWITGRTKTELERIARQTRRHENLGRLVNLVSLAMVCTMIVLVTWLVTR